jgi:hypothetical protein
MFNHIGSRTLLALTVALRAPSFAREYLSDDEAIYAAIGRAVAAGGRLFVDVVDHKPPAIYWLYAAANRVAGVDDMAVLHVLLILAVWATALVLGALARRLAPDTPHADRAAALLYVLFTTTMLSFDSLAANAELWMMLPASLSVLFLVEKRVTWVRAFGAGVLLSVAAAFKYQALVQAPVLLLPLALVATPMSVRLGRLLAAAAGLILPWALMALWFRAQGDFGEAMYWFRFNFAYIGAGTEPGEVVLRALPRIAFVVVPAALLYAAAGFGAVRAFREGGMLGQWFLAWALLSAFAVCAGARFFGHYFHQLTAPLAVIAAPALIAFAGSRRRTALAALVLPVLAFWIAAWTRDRVVRVADAKLGIAAIRPDPNYNTVVRWLDERDPRRGSLCVWGNSPLLVAQAGRPLGCRFISANFLTGLSPATVSQTDPAVDARPNVVPGMWTRFEADLVQRRPEFIVDGSPGDVAYFGKFAPERYPVLWGILERDYVPLGVVEGMRVFRRRPGI